MTSWRTLLSIEEDAIALLDQEENAVGVTLWDEYKPNPGGQQRFWDLTPLDRIEDLDLRWLGAVGGIGSGKSYTGAVWAVTRAILAPTARGLIAANTFGQLERSSLITLVEVCRQFNVPLTPYRESIEDQARAIANCHYCYIGENRSYVYVLSMTSFVGKTQAARGLQVRWAWLDEAAYSPEPAFLTLDGRMGRGPGDMKGQGLITTSPAGFNWLYDRFADPQRDEVKRRLYQMISMPTRENVLHLGSDYVEGLTSNYTEELAAQELEGAFINTSVGRIYKYFDRQLHALQGIEAEILEYDSRLPLHLTFDFNYSPAVCEIAQRRGDEIHFFKEFFFLDSDTWALSEAVTVWIREELNHGGEIYLYGDATGIARSAASRLSNWDIIFQAFKGIGYEFGKFGKLHKCFEKTNPPVGNRINSVNCLFKQNRLYLDFEGCKQLVKDFEVLNYAGEGIDKSDKLRSHVSDAAGYLIHRLYPFKVEGKRSPNVTVPPVGIAS